MVAFNINDLKFILAQIEIAEANATTEAADGTPVAGTPLSELISNPLLPYGLRTVDGRNNNIIPGRETWGAADQEFPRLLDPVYRNLEPTADPADGESFSPGPGPAITNNDYGQPGSVVDSAPRTISNLIVDQTPGNPAAIAAALRFVGIEGTDATAAQSAIVAAYQPVQAADAALRANPTDAGLQAAAEAAFNTFKAALSADYGINITDNRSLVIPNVAPDDGISAPFNSWMTLFGQFFDHGLDLVPKQNNGTVFIPLQPDDPLYVEGAHTNFMTVTRTEPDAVNLTTPFVDQNQTYTSHASHQVFLREYELDGAGRPVATGRLLNGGGGTNGLPTWAEVKAQALMLGIELTDADITNVPLLATDEYGRFLRGENGYAQLVVRLADNTEILVEGNATGVDPSALGIPGATAVRTGHAFLDDIAHTAAPVFQPDDGDPSTPLVLANDADTDTGNAVARDPLTGQRLEYDDELLNAHFITGDGRGNENIGLTAVHHVFHAEHNRLVEHIKDLVLSTGDAAFIAEWQISPGEWNGERLFQAARFGTEMQYQHLVFEEFARKVQPAVDLFVFNPTMDINPAIVAEFAHTVYRFGHSMLDETVARVNADGSSNDIGLIEAFLNPVAFHDGGTAGTLTSEEAAGAIIRGMTSQRGNEIDEFVTDALRNNLLGLPLDLATINMARGREAGVPSLNDARREFYAETGSEWLRPYTNWVDFAQSLKHPESIINFIAAYGTHASITGVATMAEKRDAAELLVLGGAGEPLDRAEFLSGTGIYADTLGGLDNVDFWIGGLAEKIHPFGGMLGSTFNFVFEVQLEKLQNGDRFYYLSRTQGTHFLTELENNSFAKLVMANTDLGGPDAPHLPGELFANVDFILEVDQSRQLVADPVHDNAILETLQPKVDRGLETFAGETYNKLQFAGGEHVVLGGTNDGRDMLIADDGDDTLWGDGGDDYLIGGHGINRLHGGEGNDIIFDGNDPGFLHGDGGDDVISAGGGIGELVFGGSGSDFVLAGFDTTEVFGGEGNDFIFGTPDVDFLLGGEGDDWIEGGEGFDTLAGDNSELFFNSTIIGHDVLFAGTNESDFDAESGDDIMVQGESVMRNEGMFGFDWAIFKGAQIDGYADMRIKIFTTVEADILRNRFDRTEALSGWNGNDTLIGDDRVVPGGDVLPGVPANEATFENDGLNREGVERIAGLDEVLGLTPGELAAFAPGDIVFDSGNILLGGSGSDRLMGGGGNDIIDGDKWLNVRILVTPRADQAWAAFSVDSMAEIQARMTSGEISPSQLQIVREIIDSGDTAATDIAMFSGNRSEYTVSGPDASGVYTVTHTPVAANALDDGTDRVRNVEVLQFADGIQILGTITNQPVSGRLQIVESDLANGGIRNGETLTVSIADIADADGVPGIEGFTFVWQVEQTAGLGDWIALEDPVTELPITGPSFTPTAAMEIEGLRLRVLGSFTGGNGIPEFVESDPVTGVIPDGATAGTAGDDLINGTPGPDTIFGLAGNDIINGLAGADTLNGNEDNDTLNGNGGADTLNGDAGNDTLNGNAGDDTLNGGAGNDTLNGNAGDDILNGDSGDDTLTGGTGLDDLAGGAGNDTVLGGADDDTIFWAVGDGRDIINGGAGDDRLRISGDASDETFFVETRLDYLTRTGAAPGSLQANSDIVISRRVGLDEAVVAELDGIDDIDVAGGGGTDTFVVSGDFAGTDLDPSTITFTGSSGNDVIDIRGRDSAHRVVIQTNGGTDTILGTLTSADEIQLAPGANPAQAVITSNGDGTSTLSGPSGSVVFASTGTPTVAAFNPAPANPGTPGSGGFTLTQADVDKLTALVRGQPLPGDDDAAPGVRTLDGHGNNIANPEFGAVDEPFIRITDAHYGALDPATGNRAINPIFQGLDARNISNILGHQEADLAPNANGANIFFMAFGQYFDHGLDFLPKGGNGTIEIGGPGMGATSSNPADLTRGTVNGYDANGVPEHLNKTSPYVDQNQAYGSHELVGQFLREGDGAGGLGSHLLQGGPDPSNPAFNLMPTLRELIQHHWENNTVFTSASLPGGSTTFRDAFPGFVDPVTGEVAASAADIKAMADNFLGSGQALLLDANPFIGLLDHFVAGDGRANENFALTAMHTVWARNHNFHVENLEAAGFAGTAEELFQAAKILNEAEYQRVVFDEFADALIGGMKGSGSHGHDNYDPNADARISHEFAAAVYRVGHSLIGQTMAVVDADGTARQVSLFDAFLNPTNEAGAFTAPLPPGYVPQPGYEQLGVNSILGGIVRQQAEEVDFNLVDAVRNDLVRIRADLFAFNVARSWDVGIGTLNQVRKDLLDSTDPYIAEALSFAGDLNPYASWEDFQARNNLSNEVIEQFKAAYPDLELAAEDIAAFQAINPDIELVNGNTVKGIDRVDVWVGGLAETHINGGMVGQTFWVVLHEQFDRLQQGDRFYYTDRLDNFDLYENFIDGQNFADIVARNTGLQGLDENIFKATNSAPEPKATVVLAPSLENAERTITAAELLAGAEDDDGDALHVVDLQLKAGSGGTLTANPDGTWTYTPAPGDETGAEFTYKVSDGIATSGEVVAKLDLLPEGGEPPAVTNLYVKGTGRSERLSGKDGDDTIMGHSGHDRMEGGSGSDKVYGHDGNDVFVAAINDGNDDYYGGGGRDIYNATAVTGGMTVNLQAGRSWGAAGSDKLKSVENVYGGSGDDHLIGSHGRNTLRGNGGDDVIKGGRGDDTLSGGEGRDTFIYERGFGNDVITDFDANPSGGQDKIDLSALGIGSESFESRVAISDLGADTLIVIDQRDKILLKGVGNSGHVTESDFVLFTS